ncbi:hypothetical protein [Zoogloea sp. LCSB751]|uniref:hypothetical protein n=1 Tax=Zoogloea sp. LCSB751 TaxID=1965277 RepID=UPI001116F4A6|nr:hypothetical protein [Zoogloea sp. LCSB751]
MQNVRSIKSTLFFIFLKQKLLGDVYRFSLHPGRPLDSQTQWTAALALQGMITLPDHLRTKPGRDAHLAG